jgi:2-polyprenyl-3-methyl-5-hydroxy-6-metoxy-1,4-benzoquinol methylase
MNKDVKKNEIDYPKKLNQKEYQWLKTKPFGNFNLEESERTFRDFSTILYLIRNHKADVKKIIELGCGPGWLSIFLSKMGFNVNGYDISPDMIEVAKERVNRDKISNVKFEVLDIEDAVKKEEIDKNDIVIIYDSLHHCQSDEKVIGHIYKYLKKGGIAILAEPNIVHRNDSDRTAIVDKFDTTERGLNISKIKKIAIRIGFKKTWRYHASGQNYLPRNECFKDSVKMIFYPLLTRFYFGKVRTRIWMVLEK